MLDTALGHGPGSCACLTVVLSIKTVILGAIWVGKVYPRVPSSTGVSGRHGDEP